MYKVYTDDILIHDSYSPDPVIHLISPNLKLSDNAAGSFEMTVPKGNPGYDEIKRFTSTIKVKKDNKTIWTGRVLSESEDFWKRRKFVCEGALSFLNDSIQELAYYDNYTLVRFFTKLIDIHNTKVPSNRQFTVGVVSMTDAKEGYEYKTDYKNTLETINEVFSNRLGGHLRVRYNSNSDTPIIEYLKDYPNLSSQEINFGNNLLDFTRNWDLSNLATVILPRGKQLDEENDRGDRDYLTIKSVNGGSKYLQNIDGVRAFGKIERIVDFNDIEDPSLLKRMGENYLASQQFDEMTLSVSAVDLHMLNPSIVSFDLLDEVRCYSAPHGLNKVFPITEIDIPLDAPENVKYTMGSSEQGTLSSISASSNKSIMNTIDVSGGNLLAGAKHQATLLINQKTTGYVNIITEQETSQALIISNTPDLETATKLWRWNLNGLGYLDKTKNPNGDYTLAITSDGVIVADFIKTGVIDDGYGMNRWDLTHGEFQFAYNTEVANSSGNTIEVLDIVNLAQSGVELADDAYHMQSGGTNILNGTNKNIVFSGANVVSNWSNGTWDGHIGSAANKTIVDISDSPNSALVKGFKIQLTSNNSLTYITQRRVMISPNQVYVLSCYAKGDAEKIAMAYGYDISNPTVYEYGLENKWRRYSITFKTTATAEEIHVLFGCRGNSGKSIYICGMKLERGNTASDWGESERDSYTIAVTDTTKYTDAKGDALRDYANLISNNDRAFTKQQRQALDESFTQYKVLQRLTNNFAAKGIYLKNNELYMNATYVRTGTLDAGIVKTGILTDKKGNNKWNMTTGYLYTKNMEAVNMQANGSFSCVNGKVRMTLSNGALTGYYNNRETGYLSPFDNPTFGKGIYLATDGNLVILANSITCGKKSGGDSEIIGEMFDGYINIPYVCNIRYVGDGVYAWDTSEISIACVNGFVKNITK